MSRPHEGGRKRSKQEGQSQPERHQEKIASLTLVAAQLRRAKEVAEAANAAKTRYLTALNHEIRSPLNAIYGYAQLLEREGAVSATEAGGVIRHSVEHLTNLVDGLLEISRIESGVMRVSSDVVPLQALLDHVVDMFRMQAAAKELTLNYVVTGSLPRYVRTDEKRLRQILINLLSNAIKYTRKGSIRLSISYRSQIAEIDVMDTGIGIETQDLERIFEPFERGNSPEAKLQPGIGLGLAITRVLVHILGGDIVASSTPGVGSHFRLRVFLPEPMTMPSGTAQYGRVIGYEGPRKTILVVDDDPTQLNILHGLLRPLDFVVYSASQGAEGMILAERSRPDLVLLDIQMSGMTGWEVAASLRAAYGDRLKIVMVSADANEFRAGEKEYRSHDAFVSKPVDFEGLLDVIGRQLGLHWQVAGENPIADAPPTVTPLPESAGPFIERLRRQTKDGQVRAVEDTLAELETHLPASAAAVIVMRAHLRNLDFRSLLKMLDDVQAR